MDGEVKNLNVLDRLDAMDRKIEKLILFLLWLHPELPSNEHELQAQIIEAVNEGLLGRK